MWNWICNDCGCLFDEPIEKMEPHGEILYWCPECDSGNFEELPPDTEEPSDVQSIH